MKRFLFLSFFFLSSESVCDLAIRVFIDGAAKAHWTDKPPNSQPTPQIQLTTSEQTGNTTNVAQQQTHSHHNRFKIIHYKASEIYLNTRLYLERGIDGKQLVRNRKIKSK